MTREEFNKTEWTGIIKAIFKGNEYEVLYADFEGYTLDLIDEDGIVTAKCEQVFLIEN